MKKKKINLGRKKGRSGIIPRFSISEKRKLSVVPIAGLKLYFGRVSLVTQT